MSRRSWSHLTVVTALVGSSLAGLTAGSAAAAPVSQAQQATTVTVSRLAGPSRIETAVAVSKASFTSADTAVLARADVYADALAGAPLAASLQAPVLLTNHDSLHPAVKAELTRLGASTVVLLGGTAAISDSVATALKDAGYTVERHAGANRFATAAAIAHEVAPGTGGPLFLVEGASADPSRGWPDALSAAPYAAFLGVPIVLTVTGELPADTKALIDQLDPSEIIIVGGTAAVGDAVEQAVAADGRTVRRLAGASRYATSAAVYDEAVTRGMDPSQRWLATGTNYPDALAAAAAAAHAGYPMLLVPPAAAFDTSPAPIRLDAAYDLLRSVVLLGGTNAISSGVEDLVKQAVTDDPMHAAFCLTVLHNNDGESRLVDAGSGLEAFGGIARFASVVFAQRQAAMNVPECDERGVITVTSGDNFRPSPEFNASIDKGTPYYDSIAFDRIDYNAMALGNHDFDFGPEVTANLIEGISNTTPTFVTANLSFVDGSPLKPLADAGRIAPSTVVTVGTHQVGIIGLTTPLLRSISSPGPDTVINSKVATAVRTEASNLKASGVDIIVLISHLQSIEEDLALVGQLSNVDIVVAGGGDEVLATPGSLLVPGDETAIYGAYPMTAMTGDGHNVPVVTTAGDYRYVGRLVTRFDADGNLVGVDDHRSRPVRVAGDDMPDAVTPDATLQSQVVDPVQAYLDKLDETVVGTSTVPLNGARPDIRIKETNEGNLMADALAYVVKTHGADYGIDTSVPIVAIQNGGGIRNATVIEPGDLTVRDTWDIAPFANFDGAFPDVSAAELKLALENGYSNVENVDGRFSHISGMTVVVDLKQQAQTKKEDGSVDTPGDRVRTITVDGLGTVYDASAGGFTGDKDAPIVTLATIDFMAGGGDQYPFPPKDEFVLVGASYQQALQEYIASLGTIDATVNDGAYAPGGNGRITINQ